MWNELSNQDCCSRGEALRRESFWYLYQYEWHKHTHIMKYSHPFLALPSSLCFLSKKKKKSSLRENEAEMARAAPALTSFDLQMLRARIFLPTAHEIWSRMWTAAGVSRGELLNSKMSCICWGLATQSRGLDAGGFSSFLIVSSPPGFVLLRVVFLKYWLKQTHFGRKLFQYVTIEGSEEQLGVKGNFWVCVKSFHNLNFWSLCHDLRAAHDRPFLNSCCRINRSEFPRNSADGLWVTLSQPGE